jgi:tryptophan synthase beta subunit
VGTTTHRFTSPAVRDVSIGAGRHTVLDRDVNGVRPHLATPTKATKTAPSAWADRLTEAVTSLTALFGPFPYPDLWVTVAPSQSDATEQGRRPDGPVDDLLGQPRRV